MVDPDARHKYFLKKTTSVMPASTSEGKQPFNPYPWWSPRFWHSMSFGDWMKLWGGARFRVRTASLFIVITATIFTPVNSMLAWLQRLKYGRQLAEIKFLHPPVFIIGHWRSGTTLLQELLCLDNRLISPTTYQCFAPNHFLISESWLKYIFSHTLPAQRPMDNMEVGWDRPQEDEFALLAMAAPSPYFRMAYPNDPPRYEEFLDMNSVMPADLKRFEDALLGFAKTLMLHSQGKRILFKSPLHTGRIETVTRIFPGAKFIHLTRNPYTLFVSTERLWDALDQVQGLVTPKDNHGSRREYVFHCLERMYAGFERQRVQLDPRQIYDVKYETLVADPLGELERIYRQLDLGDFESQRQRMQSWLAERRDYQTNKYDLDDDLKALIRKRWADYFERYGY